MNNSTDALVQLWNMCVTSQGSCPEQGLQWDTLRRVMEGLPVARCEALKTNSVDEILSYHFGPHAAGGVLNYVNFTLFWHGMEAILQTAGSVPKSLISIDHECQVRPFKRVPLHAASTA